MSETLGVLRLSTLAAALVALSLNGCTDIDANSTVTMSESSTPSEQLQSGTHTIEVAGRSRSYRLHVPDSSGPGSALALVFHGYGDSAANIETYSQMNDIADRHGFVVAYPQGSNDDLGRAFFDVGYEFHSTRVDDIAFARMLQASLVDRLDLDEQKVFVTGMSNGGDFAYHLACSGETWMAAIAPVAGMMLQTVADDCSPGRRMPIMEIHGTNDAVTLWDGDPENAGGWGAYLSQMDAMNFWVDLYELDLPVEEPVPTLVSTSPSGRVTQLRWASAKDSTELRLVRIEGGEHVWPGREASQLVWDFFSAVR